MKHYSSKLLLLLVAFSVLLAMGCGCPAPTVDDPDPCLPYTSKPTVDLPADLWKAGWAMECKCYVQAMCILNDLIANRTDMLSKKELAAAYYLRGLVQLMKDSQYFNCQSAIADFSAAIDLFPMYDAAYMGRSAAHKECGDKAAAMADWKMFKKLEAMAMAKGWRPFPRLWPKGCTPTCPVE